MCEISGHDGRRPNGNMVLPLNARVAEMMFSLITRTTIVGQHVEVQGKLQTPLRSQIPRFGVVSLLSPFIQVFPVIRAPPVLSCKSPINRLTGPCSRIYIARLGKT